MSETLENYMSSRLPIGGVAAYSIVMAHGVVASACLSKSLYQTSTEQMLNRVIHSGRALLPCGEHATHYCWTFEGQRVYVAARPDGISLALLVENSANAQLPRIKETLQDFLDLKDF